MNIQQRLKEIEPLLRDYKKTRRGTVDAYNYEVAIIEKILSTVSTEDKVLDAKDDILVYWAMLDTNDKFDKAEKDYENKTGEYFKVIRLFNGHDEIFYVKEWFLSDLVTQLTKSQTK